ncbi:tyrosine-type recombinase/integrase [Paenibacillus tepidiphilus]|uniref:tyrosine-type recombinase/integrase n=1 Tax=Paenibacillus tepidiphilus TaxID=2608683 RepID=UPI00123B02EC|nr:tyrosine-type recombinase/integrase [Paenibacillus tepidiphilus]
MSEMFNSFLQKLENEGLADRTIDNYKATWSSFKKWIFQTDPSPEDAGLATQKDIADFKQYLDNFGGRNGKPARPATTNKYFVQLNAIFKYFTEQGFISENPLGSIEKPPAAKRTPKWLNNTEQDAFLVEVRKSGSRRDFAIIVLMLKAGLRVHEICELLKTELSINARSGVAYIRGKGYKDREVPLNADVRSALEDYLRDEPADNRYVFRSQRSEQLSVRAIQHMVEKYRDRVKIKHLSCHALRHSFGHDLVTAKVDLQRVATLMGHFKEDGTPNTAMTEIYTTPGVEDLEAAVESISRT